ncbi:MAG TPA: Ig-like domain repeat protein [Acidobacteriaceae bacterium]
MNLFDFSKYALRIGTPLLTVALLSPTVNPAQSALETAKPVITLDPQPSYSQADSFVKGEASFADAPANFRSFRSARAHELGNAEPVTLRFSETTKLTGIKSTKDFRIEQGSSCVEGNVYQKGSSCNLLVRFTPQGAGRRLGRVTINHTASATPMYVGLGGYGYAPVLSFTPAQISTVTGTYPGGVGLLNSAKNLAVDGGDTLYIADTGNNLVRSFDSGGLTTLASGYSGPTGITVDTFGEVYFSRPASNIINEIYDYGPVVQVNGTATGSCPASTPCSLSSHTVTKPYEMSMDSYNHMFFTEQTSGGAFSTVQPVPANLIFLYDPFPYQTVTPGAAAMDNNDNIYSYWSTGGNCQIVQQSLYNAENNNVSFTKVVGGHTCGFAGDGGQARNAEVGSSVGQIAFDIAGNMYFTDTANNRVRRVDYTTGIISTIAGGSSAGYSGDGSAATAATLNAPSGVAVDSQGQVYVISTSAGANQVIRKLGVNGYLAFGTQLRNVASAVKMVTVSNTGNSTMSLSSASIQGTNAADFKIDSNTTSCLLTPGSTLASGQSCQIGIIFTPSATNVRSASLVFLDNTVTNSNTVLLNGSGVLPSPTVTIVTPASGSSYVSGTSIPFKVTVTYTSSPAPTGTVKFALDGTVINSGVTISSGQATLNAVVSAVGSHTIAVAYSGDANYAYVGPVSRTFTVTAAAVKKGGPISVKPVLPGGPRKLHSAASN